MTKLLFSASALCDLDRRRRFIAEHNPQAARRIAQQFKQRLTVLREQPRLGHPVENLEQVRELVLGDSVCRYVVQGNQVIVLRIWHGREDR